MFVFRTAKKKIVVNHFKYQISNIVQTWFPLLPSPSPTKKHMVGVSSCYCSFYSILKTLTALESKSTDACLILRSLPQSKSWTQQLQTLEKPKPQNWRWQGRGIISIIFSTFIVDSVLLLKTAVTASYTIGHKVLSSPLPLCTRNVYTQVELALESTALRRRCCWPLNLLAEASKFSSGSGATLKFLLKFGWCLPVSRIGFLFQWHLKCKERSSLLIFFDPHNNLVKKVVIYSHFIERVEARPLKSLTEM